MRTARAAAMAVGSMALWNVWKRSRFDLRDRVVLIAGGSRGLALALARQFGSQGARLALCARNADELARAREDLVGRGIDVFTGTCDVANRDEVERFVSEAAGHFGQIDVIVNNASIISIAPFQASTDQDFRTAMDVNFWGSYHVTQAALPYLRLAHGARIVNIASIGGAVAVPHLLPYVTAKFATVGFSQGLTMELRKEGIRVVTVLPGLMRTGSFGHALVRGQKEKEAAWFSIAASLPLLTVSADYAARVIVDACRAGDPFVVIGWPAKVLRLSNALFPGLITRLHGLVNALLPEAPAGAHAQEATPAWKHRQGAADTFATKLGDRAGQSLNETPPNPDQLH